MELTLLPPPGSVRWEMVGKGGDEGLELPFEVPFFFAEHGREASVLLWSCRERQVVGLYHPRRQVQWNRNRVDRIHFVSLQADSGPGVVGVELGLVEQEEEDPILALRPYEDVAWDWIRGQVDPWERHFGRRPELRDYGLDRE